MSLFRDTGIVLRTYRLGEADRIVVMLTEAHGKVRAVAKGVRRTSSKFGARLEPLSHVALLLWRGRGELDIVNQVEVVDQFWTIREDLERLSRAFSMLEVVDQLAQDQHPDPRLYRMLLRALGVLAERSSNPILVAPAFFLKVLALEGAAPILDVCAACGRPEAEGGLVAFDLHEGGALCRSCRRGRSMSAPALALMRRILGGELGRVLREPAPPCAEEVGQLATEAIESHLDRRLRSVRTGAAL